MDVSFHLRFCHFLLPFLTCLLVSANSNNNNNKWDGVIVAQSDYQSLQALKDELIDSRGVLKSWNNTGIINNNPCSSWAGIKCFKGRVIAIQLPWKGLSGRISEKIGLLKSLRKLSLHDNLLAGPVPASLGFLPNLRGIYLFNNRLSGSIPPSIGNCLFLRTLDLSNNRLMGILPPGLANSTRLYRLNLSFNFFSGSIPVSLSRSSSLTFLALGNNNLSGSVPNNWGDSKSVNGSYKLRSLALEHNLLSGEIPASLINLSNLSSFDVSYNNLSGVVPSLLAKKFNSTSYAGNIRLCGYTGSSPCPFLGPDSNNSTPPSQMGLKYHGRKLSTRDVIVIAACSLLIVLLILCCCLLICFLIRKKAASKAKEGKKTRTSPNQAAASGNEADSGPENGGKLVHFDCDFLFTSDDLLCATAETMGKSAYGTAYKATLEDGSNNTVAVKRLREKITKSQKEFEMEVEALGKIRHPNILSLRAYYLGPKGEKLLVYDYMSNGSLASFLHARGPETSIPWPTRKSIAIGITRGLCFLHTEQNIVHGNLTSSDILLDEQNNPKIAQAGLSRLVTSAASTNLIATAGATGYRAPEFSKLKSVGPKTDVFSLGVIILELLTGKSPSDTKDGLDLPHWVASTVKEEWTNQVFDVELLTRDHASDNVGDELFDFLKLALHCVDPLPEARPKAQQVLQKLEELGPDRADVARGPISGDDGGGRANV